MVVDYFDTREIPIFHGHSLSREDQILRRHILNLMTHFETDWTNKDLFVPYLETVDERLAELKLDGLVRVGSRGCSITEQGRPFLRNICMAFDAPLTRKQPTTQLFGRTI